MAAALLPVPPLTGFRRLFYLVSPNETSFETIQEVPPYVVQGTPFFVAMVVLETLVQLARGRRALRVNDAVGSMSAGLAQQIIQVTVCRGLDLAAYVYVYERWRVATLAWDSPATWALSFLAVDLLYYCFHRAAHEVNILWASHHVHHSSEDYNFTTALRQSFTQQMFSWVFYLPMALAIPPSQFLVHTQFNLLYQFWIHTEMIDKLPGPLEYVLNTPSHHRVHHGRNPYCIDRNYAGTLIIWDRMFGTFEPESEEVAYGTVHPIETFDPTYTQAYHYMEIWGQFWEKEGFRNKLSVLFKGPGWQPGGPRLGIPGSVPQVEMPVKKYDPEVAGWILAYIVVHFSFVVVAYQATVSDDIDVSCSRFLAAAVFIIFSITSFGALSDNKWYKNVLEVSRCGSFLCTAYSTSFLPDQPLTTIIVHFFWYSLLISGAATLSQFSESKAGKQCKTD